YMFAGAADIFNEQGVHIFSSHDVVSPGRDKEKTKGSYSTTMHIPKNLLAEGTFRVAVAMLRQAPVKLHFYEGDCASFTVVDKMEGGSARGNYNGILPGVVRPLLAWD